MGCDIHIHQEVKIGGRWYHYGQPREPRNYTLFAKMAGVRGDAAPISEPKGLPSNPSDLTLYDAQKWGQDAHTHSWLNAKELSELEEWYRQQPFAHPVFGMSEWAGYLFGNSWGGFHKFPQDRPDDIEDVRWVFWFDN